MKRETKYRTYRMMLIGIVLVQAILALLSIGLFFWDVAGLQQVNLSWQVYEVVQVLTIIGLLLGTILGAILLKRFVEQRREAEARLHTAAGEFNALMLERFDQWGLSPSESDVAMFAIKGFSNAEIAKMRDKSEGTVKAQSNSVFRKAGVSGRAQLVSLFIEDLSVEIITQP